MIYKRALYRLLWICSLLIALSSFAVSANQCLVSGTRVDARNGFCVTFEMESDGTNRVRLVGSSYYYPVWTDDTSFRFYNPAFYERSYVYEGKTRTFQVKFDGVWVDWRGNIRGTLSYYVDGTRKDQISSYNLTSVTGANGYSSPYVRIDLVGNEFNAEVEDHNCITEGACGTLPEDEALSDLICKYVPTVAQTNSYYNGQIYSGSIGFSGLSNYIHPVRDNQGLAFYQNQGNRAQCKYPSSTKTCLIDRTPIEDFPFTFSAYNARGRPDKRCRSGSCPTLPPGEYGDLKVDGSRTQVLSGGVYYFDKIDLSSAKSAIQIRDKTQIHYNQIVFANASVGINAKGKPEDLLMIGRGNNAHFVLPTQADRIVVNAYIYVNPYSVTRGGVDIGGNNNTIKGGITAYSLYVSGNYNNLYGDSGLTCGEPPTASISRLEVLPNNYHLTCEDENKVYVVAYDSNGTRLYDVGNETVTLSEQGSNKLSFTSHGFNSQEGWFEFTIDSKSDHAYEDIEIKAELDSKGSIFDRSELLFVPAKLEINNNDPLKLIAGKSETVAIKALACNASNKPITINYDQTFDQSDITVSDFVPQSGIYANKLTFSASVKNGKGDGEIKFDEAGQFNGELKDTIRCSDFGPNVQGCPDEEEIDIVASFMLYARPWTFAICSASNINGTSESGAGLTSAGESFALNVYPIAWQSNAQYDNARVKSYVAGTYDYCDLSPLNNASLSGAPAFTLNLTHEIDSPSTGVAGNLTGSLSQANTAADSNKKHQFSSLSWSEVGSVKIVADTSNSGYWQAIDAAVRGVGRFYPDSFSIEQVTWDAPDDQGGIAYMGQPFESAEVVVQAYAKDATAPLKNYHLFAQSLQAKFASDVDGSINNTLVLDLLNGQWQSNNNGESQWFLNDTNAMLKRNYTTPAEVTSTANGPFNTSDLGSTTTSFGLQITGVDPVSFSQNSVVSEQALLTQPPVRYGRMVMDSVSSLAGQDAAIPLRVEYWHQGQFETNNDDSASLLATPNNYTCKEILTSGGASSDSHLSGSDSVGNWKHVANGQSNEIHAVAHSSGAMQERVRFWMRLADTSPQIGQTGVTCGATNIAQPWLQYNWRGVGDEDPSSVITFGVFRGNDKVLFRGETGLTGQ